MEWGSSSLAWLVAALGGAMILGCSNTVVETVPVAGSSPNEPATNGQEEESSEPTVEEPADTAGGSSSSGSSGSTGKGGSVGSSSGGSSGGTKSDPTGCSNPWPSPGIFNPDCVYLMGTLEQGAAYLDVIVHPSQPNVVLGGFTMESRNPHIRPTDGRLLFDDSNRLLEFHSDPFVKVQWPAHDYPMDPLANDVALPAPACSAPWPVWLRGVFLDGKAYYSCGGYTLWVEGAPATQLPFSLDDLLAVGSGRAQLVRESTSSITPSLAVRLADGTKTSVTGVTMPSSGFPMMYARFAGTEFLLAIIEGNGASGALWKIALDGKATHAGAYSIGTGPTPKWSGAVLDASGALFFFSSDPNAGFYDDRIERISVKSPRTVVYQESAANKAKIHISQLFSGY